MAAHNRKKQGKSKTKLVRKQVQAELSLPTPAPVVSIVKETAPWPFPKSADKHGSVPSESKVIPVCIIPAPWDIPAAEAEFLRDIGYTKNTAEKLAPWAFAALAILIGLLLAVVA